MWSTNVPSKTGSGQCRRQRHSHAHALPANQHVERIPKADVLAGLGNATRIAGRGYRKAEDSFRILAKLDPELVRRSAPHAERLFEALERYVTT